MATSNSTRRDFLRRSFAFSAAMALGATQRGVSAPEIGAGDQHLLMIGDWGSGTTSQRDVAQAMKGYVQTTKIRPDGMALLGDNFYGAFKGGVDCPRWQSEFEEMYPRSLVDGPCWAMLGNHDYDDEPIDKLKAELAYGPAKNSRWTMPSKWYRFDFPAKNPLATFIVLDSNYHNARISLTDEEKAAQLKWLSAELEKPRAPWLLMMGHHPLYSNGLHGDGPALIKDWEPLFKKHGAHFYFCGHDHDMQHLELENHPTSFILSGGGGAKLYPMLPRERGPFAQQIYGFSHVQIGKERIIVRHVGPDGKQMHAMQKKLDGKVKIL